MDQEQLLFLQVLIRVAQMFIDLIILGALCVLMYKLGEANKP